MAEATITLDDYARMKDVAFRAGQVPLLWSPYLVWPTKENRASGFLVPGLGYNSQRGAYLGLNYYWVTGRSTDLDEPARRLFADGTVGVGEEFRWRPTPESAGIFQGFVVHDQDATMCVPLSQAPPNGGNGPCTLSERPARRLHDGQGDAVEDRASTTSPTTCPGTCAASSRSATTPTRNTCRTGRRTST